MKTKIIFWIAYAAMLVFLANFTPELPKKVAKIGIKESTVYLISQLEGISHTAYDDGYGNMTIGIGHLIKSDEPQLYYATLSSKQINSLLKRDMEPCERVINTRVYSPITQNQFDALMSFCHNIGPDRFAESNVIRQINRQNYHRAADAMLSWDKPAGILKMRQKQRKLFLQGA